MIGVVGMGYVGLPLALAFVEAGQTVVGVDIDADRVAALNAGESHIEDVPSELLTGLGDRFRSSVRYEDLAGADAILICVPTPQPQPRTGLGAGDRCGARLGGGAAPRSARRVGVHDLSRHDARVPAAAAGGVGDECWPRLSSCVLS